MKPKKLENSAAGIERALVRAFEMAVIEAAGGDLSFKDALKVIPRKQFESLRASFAKQSEELSK